MAGPARLTLDVTYFLEYKCLLWGILSILERHGVIDDKDYEYTREVEKKALCAHQGDRR